MHNSCNWFLPPSVKTALLRVLQIRVLHLSEVHLASIQTANEKDHDQQASLGETLVNTEILFCTLFLHLRNHAAQGSSWFIH